jgi:hypothetical protein
MNELTQHHTVLPANFGENLMKGISETRSTMTQNEGGKMLLRLTKAGQWIYGQENIAVEPDSHWAVNLASLCRGWVCWGDGELLGQIMASVQVERLPQPAPIDNYSFVEQFSLELTCISGEDDGQLVLYKNNSDGFKQAFEKLIANVQQQWAADPVYYWPVITMKEESYMNKRYGQIFKPLLPVVAWCDSEGNYSKADSGGDPKVKADERAPTPIIRGRGRPPKADYEEAAPQTTQQAHVGQRRRPQR